MEITTLGLDLAKNVFQVHKPYVKRGKTDASDAEAICEAVRARPCGTSRSSQSSSRRR